MSGSYSQLEAAIAETLAAVVRGAVSEALAEREAVETRPALLDGHGLARELGVSERQVRRLRADGMPSVRVVDSYRYELGACLGWLRARSDQA